MEGGGRGAAARTAARAAAACFNAWYAAANLWHGRRGLFLSRLLSPPCMHAGTCCPCNDPHYLKDDQHLFLRRMRRTPRRGLGTRRRPGCETWSGSWMQRAAAAPAWRCAAGPAVVGVACVEGLERLLGANAESSRSAAWRCAAGPTVPAVVGVARAERRQLMQTGCKVPAVPAAFGGHV